MPSPHDPVEALAWRNRRSRANFWKHAWETSRLTVLVMCGGAVVVAVLVGLLLVSARGNPWFTSDVGLEGISGLAILAGGACGLVCGGSVVARRWDDILLPVPWEFLTSARARSFLRGAVLGALGISVLLVGEAAPWPLGDGLLVSLLGVVTWVALSSSLAAFWLVLSVGAWLGSLPPSVARKVSRALTLGGVSAFYVGLLGGLLGLVFDPRGIGWLFGGLLQAPVALLQLHALDAGDVPGLAASLLVPAVLAAYAGGHPIRLRLPDRLFLASEVGNALVAERPPKPGFWTDLRLRVRARYRDWGPGRPAVGGVLWTLVLRSGFGIVAVTILLTCSLLGVLVGLAQGGLLSGIVLGGAFFVVLGTFLAIILPTLATLPGASGSYSTARLLPFTATELLQEQGRLVWPAQFAAAIGTGLVTWYYFGSSVAWILAGTVLTTSLLVTWGTQATLLSSSGRPHGRGWATAQLQAAVLFGGFFLLYPGEAYLAFTLTAPTVLLLNAELAAIVVGNVVLVALLTLRTLRTYPNPPSRGQGLGTPPQQGQRR